MGETAENLLKQALSLSEEDRASLAGALIESLHGAPDVGVDAAWDAVIARRVRELETHAVGTVPWAAVRERLFRGLE